MNACCDAAAKRPHTLLPKLSKPLYTKYICCSPKTERQRREVMFKELLKKCKLVRNCPHCGVANGPVKCAPSCCSQCLRICC